MSSPFLPVTILPDDILVRPLQLQARLSLYLLNVTSSRPLLTPQDH